MNGTAGYVQATNYLVAELFSPGHRGPSGEGASRRGCRLAAIRLLWMRFGEGKTAIEAPSMLRHLPASQLRMVQLRCATSLTWRSLMRALVLWMGMTFLMTATCGGSRPDGIDAGADTERSDAAVAGSGDAVIVGSGDATIVGGRDATSAATGCGNLTCTSRADDLLAGCMASGACTTQTTSAGEFRCFDNGVKSSRSSQQGISGPAGTSSSIVVSAKKGGTLCFTKTFSSYIPTSGGAAAATSTLTIANGAGETVATANGDASGAITVTCPGGVATKVDDACFTNLTAYLRYSDTPATCTEGSCTF